MKNSDELFELIHSMNGAEKRYFKIFSSAEKGKKKYLLLFNAIVRMKEYNEDTLIRSVRSVIDKRAFHAAKNYLYKQILTSLSHYFSNADPSTEIREMMAICNVLAQKGLYTAALKLLPRLRRLATECDNWTSFLQIISIEKTLYLRHASNGVVLFSALLKEEKDTLRKLSNVMEYSNLLSTYYSLVITQGANPNIRSSLSKRKAFLRSKLLRTTAHLHTTYSSMIYHYLHLIILFSCKEYESAYHHACALKELMVKSRIFLNEYSNIYLSALQYYIRICTHINRPDERYRGLSELEEAMQNFSTGIRESLSFSYTFFCFDEQLRWSLHGGNAPEKAKALVSELDAFVRRTKHNSTASEYASYAYTIAVNHLIMGTPQQALYWVNEALAHARKKYNPDNYVLARLLSLYIHYDMKNYRSLQHYVRSVERSLKQVSYSTDTLPIVLRYMRKLSTAVPESHPEILLRFYHEIKRIVEDKEHLRYFKITAWIESTLQNTTMAEIFAQRASKKK